MHRQPSYSLQDVASHNKNDDLWVIIDGKIYDLTSYMHEHPGGKKVLLSMGGSDSTKKYHKYHKPTTMAKYGDALCIGNLNREDKKKGRKFLQGIFSSIFQN